MSEGSQASSLREALAKLDPSDIRLDSEGRVVITNPAVSEQIKDLGLGSPIEALARSDTNIICCGNTKCASRATDLGAIAERFTRPQ